MNVMLKTEPLSAVILSERIDFNLPRDEFLESCLLNTKQLHQETNDSSILLYFVMLAVGKMTKGSPAVQKFTELFKELGNEECANIVHTGQYRKQDLEFYWTSSDDLTHLFEPSTISAAEVFKSSEETRHLAKTLMSDEWTDYAFHEVDKMPLEKKPRLWRLYQLENATIAYDTAEFAVLDYSGKPILDLCSAKYMHVYFTPMFRDHYLSDAQDASNRGPAETLDDAIMIQDLIRQPNFCHWLLDQLPRTRHLEDSHKIIMYKLAPFMKNMLEMMGIDSERVHVLGERAVLRVGRLTIESSMAKDFYHPCQDVNRDLIDYVEQSLSSKDAETEAPKRHVYLSRNKYEGRRISNEENLLELLYGYDFHTVYPEELSIQQQITLFRNAEVIVAPHGASLANTIFCKKVTLIEIFNQNYGTPTFYLIAKLLGFEYQHILGTNTLLSPEEKQRVGLSNLQYEDMEVDMEKIGQCLEKVFPGYSIRKKPSFIQSFFQRLLARLP